MGFHAPIIYRIYRPRHYYPKYNTMKQFLLLLASLLGISGAKAQIVNHTFCFEESDFSITTSASDSLIISSLASPSINPELTEPNIPILARSIAIPRGTLIADYTVSVSKRLIRENVDLIKSSFPMPTFMSAISFPTIPPGCYIPKIYPDSNCVVSSTLPMGEAQIVDFLVVPYVFDAVDHKLYFVDSISVQLNLVNDPEASIPTYTTQQQYDEIASTVENPQFVSTLNVD